MADPFIGEIRAVAFNYAPEGWHICDGSILQVSAYQALYALLGNKFGGTSPTSFGLPDLRGRNVVGFGTGISQGAQMAPVAWGQQVGQQALLLTSSQTPQHTHVVNVNDPGHNHAVTVPAHTHPFAVPCDDGTNGPQTPSPVNGYPTVSTGVDANVNVAIADVNDLSTAVSSGNTYPSISGTLLYAKSGSAAMAPGNTGQNAATASGATGASLTGVTVAIQPTPVPTSAVSTQSPGLGLYYIIALVGVWPPRC